MTLGVAAGLALAVSPAHAVLTAPSARTIEIRNAGAQTMVVDVMQASRRWLTIRPASVPLRPGKRANLTVRARAGGTAGDHELLVLLLARPAAPGRIAVRMRVGVRLRLRVPGRLVRRLEIGGARVRRRGRRRELLVRLANTGNVTEQLGGRVSVTLLRHGRLLSRLRFRGRREVYPEASAVVALAYAGRARGLVTAVVTLDRTWRRYRLRL